MKKTQLESLIRGIVKQILKEYSTTSLSTSDLKKIAAENPNMDPTTPPDDALTSVEKARMDREAEQDRKKQLKAKETELQTAKKEMEYQKQKVDQAKRFSIPAITKDIHSLKTPKI